MTTIERRAYPLERFRVLRADGAPTRIVGHAAVFNRQADIGGFFLEQIAPGAFAKALTGDVRALFNHDANFVLGRTANKTLTLREDDIGLAMEITPPDTQAARDLLTLIERGDVSQASFAFRAIRQEWDESSDPVVRTLLEVELFDVSPVTFPAFEETDVSVREFRAWQAGRVRPPAPLDPTLDRRRRRLRLLELA